MKSRKSGLISFARRRGLWMKSEKELRAVDEARERVADLWMKSKKELRPVDKE